MEVMFTVPVLACSVAVTARLRDARTTPYGSTFCLPCLPTISYAYLHSWMDARPPSSACCSLCARGPAVHCALLVLVNSIRLPNDVVTYSGGWRRLPILLPFGIWWRMFSWATCGTMSVTVTRAVALKNLIYYEQLVRLVVSTIFFAAAAHFRCSTKVLPVLALSHLRVFHLIHSRP